MKIFTLEREASRRQIVSRSRSVFGNCVTPIGVKGKDGKFKLSCRSKRAFKGTDVVRVSVSDGKATATATYTIKVNSAAPRSIQNGTAVAPLASGSQKAS